MKSLFWTLLLLPALVLAQPAKRYASTDPLYKSNVGRADSAHKAGDYALCASCYEIALNINNSSYVTLYKAAECRAMNNDTAGAYDLLHLAINDDFEYACPRMRGDIEFENLRETRSWLLAEALCALSFQQMNMDVKHSLDSMLVEDGRYRGKTDSVSGVHGADSPEVKALLEKQNVVDEGSLRRLALIMVRYGYPGRRLVGRESQNTAFALIQRANYQTQRNMFAYLEAAVAKGELTPAALAHVTDHIRMGEKKSQIFGTQVAYNEAKKRWEFWKIDDVENLALRRAEVGLEPITEFAQRVGAEWPIKR